MYTKHLLCYSLSYRYLPHISTWPQAARNCPLQDVYYSHMPERYSAQPLQERGHHQGELISFIHTALMLGRGPVFWPLCQVPLSSTAGGSQCSAQAFNSVWDCVPQICQCSAHAVLCSYCQLHIGLQPTKPLPIRYGTASHKATANKIWDCVPLHSLPDAASLFALRGYDSTGSTPRMSATFIKLS